MAAAAGLWKGVELDIDFRVNTCSSEKLFLLSFPRCMSVHEDFARLDHLV